MKILQLELQKPIKHSILASDGGYLDEGVTGLTGGTTGATGSTSGPGGNGGSYGGGHGGCQVTVQSGVAGGGAVRVIYHPAGASFPSTNVGDVQE